MAKSKAEAVMKRRAHKIVSARDEMVERMREKQAVREAELTSITEKDVRRMERETDRLRMIGWAEAVKKALDDDKVKRAADLERAMGHTGAVTFKDPWVCLENGESFTAGGGFTTVGGGLTTVAVIKPAEPVVGIRPEWLQEAYALAAQSDCMITLQIGAEGIEVMAQDGDGYVVEAASWKDMKGDSNPLLRLIAHVEKAMATRGRLMEMVASGDK